MKELHLLLLILLIYRFEVAWSLPSPTYQHTADENLNIYKAEKETNNWDCTENEAIQNEQLENINAMLEGGENAIINQNETALDKIIVLGNAGAGKTTFVQFIAGDNDKLISKEVGNDTGEYIIEDGKKIGSSVTESFTLYPEQLELNNKTAISDTPGFSDTRSAAHEIVATYVMKKYLKNSTRVKIVLLITYNSVQHGIYKDDFINLLRNLNNFIKDVDKYKNSIALIASKVPNSYKINNGMATLIPDKNIVISIAEYIFRVKKSLQEKLEVIKNDENEKSFIKNSIKIIDNLLEVTDNDGNYKKINIFRRPTESGKLSSISSLQERKNSLTETILNNIDFVELKEHDIGYSLSDKAKNYLDCLLRYINKKIIKLSSKIFESIQNYYSLNVNIYTDLYSLVDELNEEYNKLEILKNELDYSNNYKIYTNIIKKFILNLKNSSFIVDDKIQNEMNKINLYITKIEQFSNVKLTLTPVLWSTHMKSLLSYVKDNHTWYTFLIKIFDKLSNYKIQESKLKFYNYSSEINSENYNSYYSSNRKKISVLQLFLSNSQFLLDENINSYFKYIKFDDKKLKELEEVVSATIKIPVNVTCDNEGKLLISGYFVKVSEISKDYVVKHYCGDKELKVIVINAVHTVFIDADLDDQIFRGVNLMIVAPNWQIIGPRKIILDGHNGDYQQVPDKNNTGIFNELEFFNASRSKSEYELVYGKQGADGEPGLPGENGGNFFGIGLNFVNGESLTVSINGGDGGKGKNGENGVNGEPGKDGFQLFKDEPVETDVSDGTSEPSSHYITEIFITGFKNFNDSLTSNGYGVKTNHELWSHRIPWAYSEQTTIKNYESNTIPLEFSYFGDNGCASKIEMYVRKGTKGSSGGKGGNAGKGGLGGNSGHPVLIELKEESKIQILTKPGNLGSGGIGGMGGKEGAHGSTISCFSLQLAGDYCPKQKYWRCMNSTDTCENPIIKYNDNGISDYNDIGIIKPNNTINYDFLTDLLNYVIVLEENRNNKLFSNISSFFKKEILERKFKSLNNDLLRLALINDQSK